MTPPDGGRTVSTAHAATVTPEHALVVRALKIALLTHKRPCAASEVLALLPPHLSEELPFAYPQRAISRSVQKILDQLFTRGVVAVQGKVGGRRYYYLPDVLPPAYRTLPGATSRRSRVLRLLDAAVTREGRALRTCDVVLHAQRFEDDGDLRDVVLVGRTLRSLTRTGHVRVVASVRGGGKDGSHLYVPASANPEDFSVPKPLTWLEEVLFAFNELWSERQSAAPVLIEPLTTREVTERLRQRNRFPDRIEDKRVVPNALGELSRSSNPAIRQVRIRARPQAALWVPVGVRNRELKLATAFTTEEARVGEALRRAMKYGDLPAAFAGQVEDEVQRDPELELQGDQSVARVLSDASREQIPDGRGGTCARVHRTVHSAGVVNGRALYVFVPPASSEDEQSKLTSEARAYALFRLAQATWERIHPERERVELEESCIPTVRQGRVIKLIDAVASVGRDVGSALAQGLPGRFQKAAEDLRTRAEGITNALGGCVDESIADLRDRDSEPDHALTSAQLLALLLPFEPSLVRFKKTPTRLVSLYASRIARIPNPHPSADPAVPDFLFDRFSALAHLSGQGGPECMLQATLASRELGPLRQALWARPALNSAEPDKRRRAIACCCFLHDMDVSEEISSLALNDPDPGVRRSALWAAGILNSAGVRDLLGQITNTDPDSRVRRFAAAAMQADGGVAWWQL